MGPGYLPAVVLRNMCPDKKREQARARYLPISA